MEIDSSDEQVSITIHDYESPEYDSDCESSSESVSRQFKPFAGNGMVKLREDDREFSVIKKSFVAGMGLIGKELVNVVAVHKNSYSNVTGQARMEMFRVFSRAVAERRGGDCNVKYAWYGGSRDEICGVVAHGFGGFEKGGGTVSHGVGVHLSPVNVAIDSALRAEEDGNGVRHMLLCRVILGNTETIPPGSKQFQPSSPNFDSGIDNPLAPRKYIIWSPYMNSHIFPNYIISFTGSVGTWNSAKRPNSPSMKLPVLLNVLSNFLEPAKMGSVLKYYNDFRDNKIHRSQLIYRLRSLVGDRLLTSVIKLCRDERV